MKGEKRPDGCATFFRSGRFTLLAERRIAFSDGDGGRDSGNIVQLLLLGHEGKRLEIANTHLKWDPPETPRERKSGYRQILQAIEALHPDGSSPDGQILCGDLNVDPDSDVIEALLAVGFDFAHRQCPGAFTCNSNKQAKLIDHLFYRGSLRARPIAPAKVEAETPLPSPEPPVAPSASSVAEPVPSDAPAPKRAIQQPSAARPVPQPVSDEDDVWEDSDEPSPSADPPPHAREHRPSSAPPPPEHLPERRVVVIDEDAELRTSSRPTSEVVADDEPVSQPAVASIGATLEEEGHGKRRWRLFRKGGE
jgi:hypothetical protein